MGTQCGNALIEAAEAAKATSYHSSMVIFLHVEKAVKQAHISIPLL